jgi:hypothetical protein
MDRDRFRTQARELRSFAEKMSPLAKMPDRVNADDVKLVAELATKAADSLDELLEGALPGCICRRIHNDNYSYLNYAESCVHHGSLFALEQRLKEDYAKMEKVLKNELRVRLVAAVLSGTAAPPQASVTSKNWWEEPEVGPSIGGLVKRAIAIADTTIRQLTEVS